MYSANAHPCRLVSERNLLCIVTMWFAGDCYSDFTRKLHRHNKQSLVMRHLYRSGCHMSRRLEGKARRKRTAETEVWRNTPGELMAVTQTHEAMLAANGLEVK